MAEELKKITEDELKEVAGGVNGKVGLDEGPWMEVANPKTGWLALRSDPSYNYNNEIGKLYNGYKVKVCGNGAFAEHDFDKGGATNYIWVYSPDLNKSGWVNSRFIR